MLVESGLRYVGLKVGLGFSHVKLILELFLIGDWAGQNCSWHFQTWAWEQKINAPHRLFLLRPPDTAAATNRCWVLHADESISHAPLGYEACSDKALAALALGSGWKYHRFFLSRLFRVPPCSIARWQWTWCVRNGRASAVALCREALLTQLLWCFLMLLSLFSTLWSLRRGQP